MGQTKGFFFSATKSGKFVSLEFQKSIVSLCDHSLIGLLTNLSKMSVKKDFFVMGRG